MRIEQQDGLLAEFVGTFGKFYELAEYADIYPIVAELAVGEPDDLGQTHWQPPGIETDSRCLDPLYAKLPGRFPLLYERFVLTYGWAEVDLGRYTLLANPPGPDLSRLLNEISKDPALWESLIPTGYIQFAKGSDYGHHHLRMGIRFRPAGPRRGLGLHDGDGILRHPQGPGRDSQRMDDPRLHCDLRFRHLPRLQRLRTHVPFEASQRSVDNPCLGFLGSPLFITELIFQLRRMRKASARA